MSQSPFFRLTPRLRQGIVNILKWNELSWIQELAIPPLLDGANALLIAPTAGGKTEAAMFPLLDRVYRERMSPISGLYISPLRALLNNQEPRLRELAGLVDARVFKWHGDVKRTEKCSFRRAPGHILMITPESLEVLLLSKRSPPRRLFRQLQFVVIDEIHAFAQCDRGTQLISILERIQAYARGDIQRVGLSATVGNTRELALWLQGSSSRPLQVIEPGSNQKTRRDIQIRYLERRELPDIVDHALPDICGNQVLFFTNSRSDTEDLKTLLDQSLKRSSLNLDTFVHHSCIDKFFREVAEERMRRGDRACIVCTSTLELGIDVGDLDLVLQLAAPHTVSSLMQRLGRTGRRRQNPLPRMYLYPRRQSELLMAIALIELARRRWVEPIPLSRRAYHILFQQLIAIILERDGISRRQITDLLSRPYAFQAISSQECAQIIDLAKASGLIEEDNNRLYLGNEGERKLGYANFLKLFSVFDTPTAFTVRHGQQAIGTLDSGFVRTMKSSARQHFVLAGRLWQLTDVNEKTLAVYVEPAGEGPPPRWHSQGGRVAFEVCQKILQVLTEDTDYPYLQVRGREEMQSIRQEFRQLEIAPNRIVIDSGLPHSLDIYTFAGDGVNQALKLVFSLYLAIPVYTTPLKLSFFDIPPEYAHIELFLDVLRQVQRRDFVRRRSRDLESTIDTAKPYSKFQEFIPPEFARRFLMEHSFDLAHLASYLPQCRLRVLQGTPGPEAAVPARQRGQK